MAEPQTQAVPTTTASVVPTSQTPQSISTPVQEKKITSKQGPSIAERASFLDARKAYMRTLGFPSAVVMPASQNKYASIHTLKDAQKIEALKDPRLVPSKIEDGYDSIAHAMWLWTQVGAKAKASPNISFTEQRQIADNFYQHVLGPAYVKAGLNPIDRELWHKQAYEDGLKYDIKDAYTNNWLHALKHGWNVGLVQAAQDTSHLVNMAGDVVDDAVALWRRNREQMKLPDAEQQKLLRKPWYEQFKDLHNFVSSVPHDRDTLINRGAIYQEQHRQFWADVLPTHNGMVNKATSFVVEQAGAAPAFAAISLGAAPVEAIGETTGLTAKLTATPAGRRLLGYLTAGAEGTAYGVLTKPQDNPAQHLRDGLSFMVFHGLFDVAGMGLVKLQDILPNGSKELERLKARRDKVMLSWEKNQRLATPAEEYDAHVKGASNAITVSGLAGFHGMQVDGLEHLQETENMSRAERLEYEKKLLTEDPARWTRPIAVANFARKVLGKVKLTELESGSQLETKLKARLQKLAIDGAGKINTNVKDIKAEAEATAEQNLKQPSAKHTLDYYVKQVQRDLGKDPGAAKLVTQEQILKAAQKRYAADLAKASEHAEKEVGTPKIERATDVSKRVKTALKVRSERKVAGKDISVRYAVEPDYKVRLAAHKSAAKQAQKSLRDYFADLSDEDFKDDLTDYFYPKALKEAKVFFEHQNTKEGMQNPNFLAFMYNYRDFMPKEFSDELKDRLINTVKVQKGMNNRALAEPQLTFYAKSMYNHVDNFLGSGRWPKESNIFRSSQDQMWHSTEWQRELLMEKMVKEQKILTTAFSGQGNEKARGLALASYAKFAKLRLEAFDAGASDIDSPDKVRLQDINIANLLTSTGKFESWEF